MIAVPPAARTIEVTRTAWWMHHYFAPTPKRHFGYSNSAAIAKLDRGVLSGWKKRKSKSKVQTAVTYKDKSGKTRYKGTPALRKTENLDCHISFFEGNLDHPT